jgi:hypothetical protein
VTKKKRIIRFEDGCNLLEGCSLLDFDEDISNDSNLDKSLPVNGTIEESNTPKLNGIGHSSPPHQRKSPSGTKEKVKKSVENVIDSNPDSPEEANQQVLVTNFVRKLSTNALRSSFRQMHMEDSGPNRDDGM